MSASNPRMRKHALAVAIAAFAMPAFAGQVGLTSLKSGEKYDEFIVKYRDGSNERAHANTVAGALQRATKIKIAGKHLALGHSRRLAIGADLVKADKKLDRADAETLMRQIAADPNVDWIEPNARMYPTLQPNDTSYNRQWGFNDADAGIKAEQAWDRATGEGVVVAVIDTGITAHTDLDANILPGYDFITDSWASRDGDGRDNNPRDEGDWSPVANECGEGSKVTNSSFHGTHVAGTIAAVTNNARGVAGTAHNARIVPVRVLGRCGGTLADIADAITWASGGAVQNIPANPNPAEVINMSLGGSGACSPAYQEAINGAVDRGTTVVVAAGNQSDDVANHRPANCANVIAVASIDNTGQRSWFSNYGAGIDVAAPGSDIYSTINTSLTVPGAQGYAMMSGTSMAAPHVAGVVALLQSAVGQPKTPAQVEALIRDHASDFPVVPDQDIGEGIVNAQAVVEAVIDAEPAPAVVTLVNGVAVANLSAAKDAYLKYKIDVPAGASDLSLTTSGGAGNANMYVRFGAEPTDATYDCRPNKADNAETCTFAAPKAGTYYLNLKAASAFNGVGVVGRYSKNYSNTTDYAINDTATVDSPIVVSGRNGNAPGNASVTVNIAHTYIGDLKVDLVAPDNSVYNIHNRTGAGTDNINKTVTLNLSSEALNGSWKLRVNDNAAQDTGKIDSWSIKF